MLDRRACAHGCPPWSTRRGQNSPQTRAARFLRVQASSSRIGPMPAKVAQYWGPPGRTLPNLGRNRQDAAGFRPDLPNLGHTRPKFVKLVPRRAEFDDFRTKLARHDFAQIGLTSAEVRPNCAEFGTASTKLDHSYPEPRQLRPMPIEFPPSSAKFGPISARSVGRRIGHSLATPTGPLRVVGMMPDVPANGPGLNPQTQRNQRDVEGMRFSAESFDPLAAVFLRAAAAAALHRTSCTWRRAGRSARSGCRF